MNERVVKVLFVHGWASSAAIWSRCAEQLEQMLQPVTLDCDVVDRGYFGDRCKEFPRGHFDLAVGHSTGLSWLISQQHASFDKLVSICGFTRFCSGEGFAAGWSPGIVERMCRQLAKSPNSVVGNFWQKASTTRPGHAHPPRPLEKPNAARLQEDLQALPSIDCRQQWTSLAGAQLVIAGTADQIITAEHSQLCFGNQRMEWIQTDSHWIPWTFPETCAALLREMIEVS